MKSRSGTTNNFFKSFSAKVTRTTGGNPAIIIVFSSTILLAVMGYFFYYSESWQMIINTIIGIVTSLMVFLIQKPQNKESLAVQLKLNELIAAHKFASNRLVDVENMTEEELKIIQKSTCI
jgi:low affinity Fe/Cu permease